MKITYLPVSLACEDGVLILYLNNLKVTKLAMLTILAIWFFH